MPKLSDTALKNHKGKNPLTDTASKGLRFVPTETGAKWILRYVSPVTGIRRSMGLGTYPATSLADARAKASEMRTLIEAGKDPIEERDTERRATRAEARKPTFGEAAIGKHAEAKKAWKQTKNVARWLASVEQYFKPILHRRVDTLIPDDFADCLRPFWMKYPRSTEDVLARAKYIMRWCYARRYIDATLLHAIDTCVPELLPSRDVAVTAHHPALPFEDAPAFVAEHLADIKVTDVVRACVFVQMHAACRPGEARGMRWSELNLDAAMWMIPGERMKMKRYHKVPLPAEVVALLRRMSEAKLHEDFVFPNTKGNNPISDVRLQEFLQAAKAPSDVDGRAATPHGFRATFKNWTIETKQDELAAERQLAHAPKGETMQAYERNMRITQRTPMMALYADYLHGRKTIEQLLRLNLAAA